MTPFALTVYVLIWPAVVGGTLAVIGRAFLKEAARARREGRTLV